MRIVELLKVDPALIRRVTDRPAHDMRYATDASRAKEELGWCPGPDIDERLPELISWYRDNRDWWQNIKTGGYRDYYERMYGQRGV